MYIVFIVIGSIKVYDQNQLFNIQASGCYRRCHQDWHATSFEVQYGAVTVNLVHPSMEDQCPVGMTEQVLGNRGFDIVYTP